MIVSYEYTIFYNIISFDKIPDIFPNPSCSRGSLRFLMPSGFMAAIKTIKETYLSSYTQTKKDFYKLKLKLLYLRNLQLPSR